MKSKLITFSNTSTDYEIQTKELDGVEYLVVPVIMMVEGVHNGSAGPMLYTTEELGRIVQSWDGIPVVIQHPVDDKGNPVSANTPNLVDNIVGRIYNTHMDGDKLKAEAWVNVNRIQDISQDAYDSLIEHQALEVSIGAFHEELDDSGNFNNENYTAIATNLRPDHLALLPGVEGACNWDDGCGIRINKKGTKKKGDKNEMKNLKTLSSKELLKEGYTINSIINHLTDHAVGFLEIVQNLRQKVDQLDNDVRINFLEEVFDDEIIYRVHNRETGDTTFLKRGYTVNEDGTVDFTDADPVEVRKETEFVSVNEKSKKKKVVNNNVKPKTKVMTRKKTPCDIDGLIANEATQFTEENREWLGTLDQEQLDLLSPVEVKPVEEPVLKRTKPAPVANIEAGKTEPIKNESLVTKDEDGVIKINGKSIEEHFQGIVSNSDNPEEFIQKFMPSGLKGQMESGLKMYNEKRATQIAGIVANSKFEEKDLEKWSDVNLQNLHDSVVKEEADYSAQGSIVTQSSGEADPELVAMTGIKPNESK